LKFFSTLSSKPNGVCIVSGEPGVGKTSFLNVQQYRMENRLNPIGPQVMANRERCTIRPDDSTWDIAQRALYALSKSVEHYCAYYGKPLPKPVEEILDWISGSRQEGININLSVLGSGGGFGRSINIPPISEITYEGLGEALNAISILATNLFDLDAVVVCLDNIENLNDDQLYNALISFRDTLFDQPYIWWILVGQSGLGGAISSLDSRVAERIAGEPLELSAVSKQELNEAIDRRVKRFREDEEGESPLPHSIHNFLYEQSNGELRFVLKHCEDISIKFVNFVLETVAEHSGGRIDEDIVKRAMGEYLAKGQIPYDSAHALIQEKVRSEFDQLYLRPKDIELLSYIGEEGTIRPKQYEEFGLRSNSDFVQNYLQRLYKQNLLTMRREGRATYYSLRGLANLLFYYGFLGGKGG
jgi:hypothetical protein